MRRAKDERRQFENTPQWGYAEQISASDKATVMERGADKNPTIDHHHRPPRPFTYPRLNPPAQETTARVNFPKAVKLRPFVQAAQEIPEAPSSSASCLGIPKASVTPEEV